MPSALKRRVDDGKPLFVLLEGDAGDAKHLFQLLGWHLHWAGRRCGAGHGLRESRRARGVAGDVALIFRHRLGDVAVEHGDRAEALKVAKRLSTVISAPAPLRIDGPQRNVGEDYDRLWGRAPFKIVLEPLELVSAEIAK